MDVYELWAWVWLAGILLAWIFAVLFSAWVDSRKPRRFRQRDHVAEAKRRVSRNAFKTRAGIR